MRYLRLKQLEAEKGLRHAKFYADINCGLMVPPIKDGRISRWDESEIDAILAYRAAGASEEEIRELVQELKAARQGKAMKARARALGMESSEVG